MTTTIFHSDSNPVLCHVLFHSVDKTHVLVITVKLIWLLFLKILFLNFLPTPNKPLRFTRFRRSYVNLPVAVLILSYIALFCFMCIVQSRHVSFFCSCFSPMIVHLRILYLLSTPVARMLLTPR